MIRITGALSGEAERTGGPGETGEPVEVFFNREDHSRVELSRDLASAGCRRRGLLPELTKTAS